MNRALQISASKQKLVQAAAEKIIENLDAAVRKRGRCSVALAGGTTPRAIYALLATENYRSRVEWPKVFLFWGDERTVPPDHPDSNFRMVNESLLSHIAMPAANIVRIKGERDPVSAASEYEKQLEYFFGAGIPQFDLILLGLGDDGHTASLFPGTNALDETQRNVLSVFVPKLNTYRITLTLRVINNARRVMFMIAGRSKAAIVSRVAESKQPTHDLPATLVQPRNGQLDWLLDGEAASLL